MWEMWVSSAFQHAKNIHPETGESVAIQSRDGDQVEIIRDNVEEIIEAEGPEEP